MKTKLYNLITAVLIVVLLVCFSLTAAAENLPDGSVKVLPEHLVVLDDSGRSVSENGEYYFVVEDMTPTVTYTKKIQIMNLREDGSYRITMRTEPIFSKGEIDLEKECSCEMLLSGDTVYSGSITGDGTPDMQSSPLDLGEFEPGESKTLTVNIRWNGTDKGGEIDNGHIIVSHGGVEVERDASGVSHIEGETEFKWIFYAEAGDDVGGGTDNGNEGGDDDGSSKPTPSTPGTDQGGGSGGDSGGGMNAITSFVKTGGVIAVGSLVIVMGATFVMMILLAKKKKRSKTGK